MILHFPFLCDFVCTNAKQLLFLPRQRICIKKNYICDRNRADGNQIEHICTSKEKTVLKQREICTLNIVDLYFMKYFLKSNMGIIICMRNVLDVLCQS